MDNLNSMRTRLRYQGGLTQQERMVHGKYKAFKDAAQHSYQGAKVKKLNDLKTYAALINPDKNKIDYDDKEISIDYEAEFKCGDIFEWVGTNTKWLIYLKEKTELAYFRGSIRLCKYQIHWKDKEGKVFSTWAAIRGPSENNISTATKKENTILDIPNFSLRILVPNNKNTLEMFKRYNRFLFNGKAWQVQATDSVSAEEIIEISALEYYINKDTDDISAEIADGLIIQKVDPNVDSKIIGDTRIKPRMTYEYRIEETGGTWEVDRPEAVEFIEILENKIRLKWTRSVSGQFSLHYRTNDFTFVKIIIVESLF